MSKIYKDATELIGNTPLVEFYYLLFLLLIILRLP